MVALAIVVVAVVTASAYGYLSPSLSPNAGIRDSDLDGFPDDRDAFRNEKTQWADRDGDGFGDNPQGLDSDLFPDDPSEWQDSDSDSIGDNADIYDAGNGAVRISITYLAVEYDCDPFSHCDPYFVITIDVDGDGTAECALTTPEYDDMNSLTNPSGASLVCDLPESESEIELTIKVYDRDFRDPDEPIDYAAVDSSAWYVYTLSAPFSGSQSETGDGTHGFPAQLAWAIRIEAA